VLHRREARIMFDWLKSIFRKREGRTFVSKDPAVGELATKIDRKYPGMVEGVNVPVNRKSGEAETDIDISTKKANVEVKSRSTKGMRRQLKTLKKISRKEPIGYAPYIVQSEVNNIKRDGIKVFRCDDCLVDYLGWKKKHPFSHKDSYRDVDCRKGKIFSSCYHKKGRK
jgi:hypothetical protein